METNQSQIKKTTISIIVSNYNGKKFLVPCIRSLLREKSSNYEVIFVDDYSLDGSFEHVRKTFKNNKKIVSIRLDRHKGTAGAINTASKISRGKYLFFLNNDTIVQPGWSSKIEKIFDSNKKLGCIQAKILRLGKNIYDYAGDYMGPFGFLIERARGAEDKGQFDYITEVFSVKGTAMIVRRDLYMKLGMMDEDYIFGIEETDLTWRIWLSGYIVQYFPFIKVWHAYGTKAKNKQYYIDNKLNYFGCRNTIITLLKNLGSQRLITVFPLHILTWIILSIMFFITFQPNRTIYIVKALVWNLINIKNTLKKRDYVQKMRKISDENIFKKVGKSQSLIYYLKKGLTYISGHPFDIVQN